MVGVIYQYPTGCWLGGGGGSILISNWLLVGYGGTISIFNWLLIWWREGEGNLSVSNWLLVGRGEGGFLTNIQLLGWVEKREYPTSIQLIIGLVGGNGVFYKYPTGCWFGVWGVPYQYPTGCWLGGGVPY